MLSYIQAVDYILKIPRFTKKNPKENTKKLMELLGNPQDKIKTIHVAGTNGKGSTCAFMAQILQSAKKSCGLFTSPHLMDIRERFRINGQIIDEDTFLKSFIEVKHAIDIMTSNGYAHPTFFETIFAMGAYIFEKENVDYAIFEAGMGGENDTTNCILKPEVSVITSIGLDHTGFLGNTIEQIAHEKSGIIKQGVPVIFDASDEKVKSIMQKKADALNCEYFYLTNEKEADSHSFYCEIQEITNKNIDFLLNNGYYGSVEFLLGQIGDYQVKNASLAIMAIRMIIKDINKECLYDGILNTRWEGRMENILPNVYIDGAHNEAGINEFIKTASHFDNENNILLFSAVKDKDYPKMISQICKNLKFSAVAVTRIDNERAVECTKLADIFKANGTKNIIIETDIEQALKKALDARTKDGMLFCVGSLYLIGSIKTIIRRKYNDKF